MPKLFLITGATSGIGFETARQIALMGHQVIGVGSSIESCTKANDKMLKSGTKVEFYVCNLSDPEQIKNFADDIKLKYTKLDVLINNAGVIYLRRLLDSRGIEKTFSINYLSHYLLTRLLLDIMGGSNPTRIINVSSVVHEKARIDFSDLNTNKYNWITAYGRSKLAQILFTRQLAILLDSRNITVNAMHPGLISTNLISKNGLMGVLLTFGLKLIGKSPQKGVPTLIKLATSNSALNISGKYYVNHKEVKLKPHATDKESAKMLWDISAQLCKLPKELKI